MNETREGWDEHYELVWEDTSPEGVPWVESEFQHLWARGKPLPDTVIEEIGRCARKLDAVVHFLVDQSRLELGCIVLGQYHDTAR